MVPPPRVEGARAAARSGGTATEPRGATAGGRPTQPGIAPRGKKKHRAYPRASRARAAPHAALEARNSAQEQKETPPDTLEVKKKLSYRESNPDLDGVLSSKMK